MTETLTIPAHIENGSLLLDAPLPSDVVSVEVRAKVSSSGSRDGRRSVAAYLESLPPGDRTAEEIDQQMKAERDAWPE
jgi:hypothetical protein